MKIHLFSDHTGMVEARVRPEYKTEITIIGNVSQGTLSLGSKNFDIKGGAVRVPVDAFGSDTINVVVTAKEGGKLRHWICGKLIRDKADGSYAPVAIDGHAALLSARRIIDELQVQVTAQAAEIKKLKERASKKFLGGSEI
jgi:hypothetical protein